MKTSGIKEIKLGFSCTQEWSKMSKQEKNRHCEKCNKVVFDFSGLSNQEVVEFLSKRTSQKTCGRFTEKQLININSELADTNKVNLNRPFLMAAAFTTLMACSTTNKMGRHHYLNQGSKHEILEKNINPDSLNTTIVKGLVFDDMGWPLIGAYMTINEMNIDCSTDIDGNFEIKISNSELTDINNKNLKIRYTGFEEYDIKLIDVRNNEIQIDMGVHPGLLGDIVIIKQPFYKRIWVKFKNGFRRN